MNSVIKEDIERIIGGGLNFNRFRNSTFLVTGANGFLASFMIYVLLSLKKNVKVIAVCRDITKTKQKLIEFLGDPNLRIVKTDITRKINFNGRIDYVIHAASPASSQYYGVKPVEVIAPNVLGTNNLLVLAKEKKVKGFLFFSSGEASGAFFNKSSIKENNSGYLDPFDIRSCYGESKRMAENMCACWARQYRIPTYVVRPEHIYGPGMDLVNDKRVYSEFVSDIVNDRNITLNSDGKAVRTFCYLSDATEGFFRVLLKGKPGECYHVGNKKGRISIKDLANKLVVLFPEKKLKVVRVERKSGRSYLENKNKIRPTLSTGKIEKIGYRCRVGIGEGFRRSVRSYE